MSETRRNRTTFAGTIYKADGTPWGEELADLAHGMAEWLKSQGANVSAMGFGPGPAAHNADAALREAVEVISEAHDILRTIARHASEKPVADMASKTVEYIERFAPAAALSALRSPATGEAPDHA